MTYSEVAYKLGIGQKTVGELGNELKTMAGTAVKSNLSPLQQKALELVKDEVETLIVDPIKHDSKVAQNTVQYSTGGDGQTIKYDVTAGASSFSAYLQSDQEAISGDNARTADYDVMSHLSYASKWSDDADYLSAVNRENVTVKEYCDGLLEHGDQLSNVERQYLQELSESKRFSGLKIDHSIGNTTGDGSNTRVLVLSDGDGHAFVSVQGTNGTVEDWKTNGKFVQSRPTSEERWVAGVVDGYAGEYETIDLTGHSQGGREAVTTAILMSPENKSKIQRIVSNDGPGYSQAFKDRYNQEIADIEGKVLNIRPTDSKVGELLYGIGEVQYVNVIDVINTKHNGEVGDCDHHEGLTWYIDENGNYLKADGTDLLSPATLAKLSGILSDDLLDLLPEDRVVYYLNSFMELCGDADGNFAFKNLSDAEAGKLLALYDEFIAEIKQSIDKMAEEELTETGYFLHCVCRDLADIFGEISSYLTYAEYACKVFAKLLPPAAPVFDAFRGLINKIEYIPKACGYLFRGFQLLIDYFAADRAMKKKEARKEYIAQNKEMKVNTILLMEASKKLNHAATSIFAAYCDYKRMLTHFRGKLRAAALEMAGASEETVEEWSGVTYGTAKTYCWQKGVHDFDQGNPCLMDASQKVVEIANDLKSITRDTYFEVIPSSLEKAAGRGVGSSEFTEKELDEIETNVKELAKSWIGEDFDSVEQKIIQDKSKCYQYAKVLGPYFSKLIEYAEQYSKQQEKVIEKFQNIKLKFY